MRSDHRMINQTTILLLAAFCVFLGYQATATRNVAAPTRVAVVQLKKVMDSIQQRAVIEANLEKMRQAVLEEERVKREEIEAVRTEIRTLVGDDVEKARQLANDLNPQYLALTEKIEDLTLKYSTWQRFTLDSIDLEQSLGIQKLYNDVKTGIANLASAEGYDLVLIDDSRGDLQINPDSQMKRSDQLMQQISLRKLLHASPAIDITEDVIVRMNNAFNAAPGNNAGGNP